MATKKAAAKTEAVETVETVVEEVKKTTRKVINTVTAVREEVAADIAAVRQRDPAARSDLEILLLYSAIWCRRPGSNRHGISPTGF